MSITLFKNGIQSCPSCGRLASVDSKSCTKCGWLLNEGITVGMFQKPTSNLHFIEHTERLAS